MRAKGLGWLMAGLVGCAGAAYGQDADLTIFVDGALLEHGGLVEVWARPVNDLKAAPQTITLTDRYAKITLQYPAEASYNFRFRPVPSAMNRDGMSRFATQLLSVGTAHDNVDDVEVEFDAQDIRVLPFAEYGAAEPVERASAAWGEVERFDDPPPANEWGARALPQVFDTFGDRRVVGLICTDQGNVSTCTPDPRDALLIEALWWREIAEGRLEKLRDAALRACYDSGGLFKQPEHCDGVAGDGWPAYVPAD
jgi:hypothetical protein